MAGKVLNIKLNIQWKILICRCNVYFFPKHPKSKKSHSKLV